MELLLEIIKETIAEAIEKKKLQMQDILENFNIDQMISKKKEYYKKKRDIEALEECSKRMAALFKYIEDLTTT